MHFSRELIVPLSALALALAPARQAAACGGVFTNPSENTEVASHRMVISISTTQSTLYDQIKYTGAPSSFAWVLPIAGPVTVGLSSDALFEQIDQLTAVSVQAPPECCPFESSSESSSGGGGFPDAGGVTVLSQMVVGPYETVQLSSTDPTALTTWLTTNGYAVPSTIAPIIAAYVSEGFDFLAMKLVPGASVSAMQPVRVTTPGASPVLPLRMVAAGAGATVPITLFVVGEGRYQPANFPWFTISQSELTWDFGTESSNYTTLQQQKFTATSGTGWQVESATPLSEQQITGPITYLASYEPLQSGYADSMGNGAPAAAQADLSTLFSGISASSLWITRLLAELPLTALSTDLTLGAATSQTSVPTLLTPPASVNDPCPCGTGAGGAQSTTSAASSASSASSAGGVAGGPSGVSGAGGAQGSGGAGGAQGTGGAGTGGGSSGGCAYTTGAPDGAPLGLTVLFAALAVAAPRRRKMRAR